MLHLTPMVTTNKLSIEHTYTKGNDKGIKGCMEETLMGGRLLALSGQCIPLGHSTALIHFSQELQTHANVGLSYSAISCYAVLLAWKFSKVAYEAWLHGATTSHKAFRYLLFLICWLSLVPSLRNWELVKPQGVSGEEVSFKVWFPLSHPA